VNLQLASNCQQEEFCEQVTAEMKRMLFNYLAPIFGSRG
jgi:hypothetical protein